MNEQKNKNLTVAISSAVITATAIIIGISAVNIFSEYTEKHFAEYAKNSAETLANQASAIIEETKDEKPTILEALAKATIKNDKNIAFIELSDTNEKVFLSIQSKEYTSDNFSGIKVNTPVNVKKDGKYTTTANLKMFISDKSAKEHNKQQKAGIIGLISFLWLIVTVSWAISRHLIKREINLLCFGLKHISDGHFGTKIKIEGRKETKELIDIFNDLSTKLKNYEEQNVGSILLERNKLEAVLMSIVNGVVVCNNEDEIVLINLAAEKMLSVSGNNVKGIQIQCYSDTQGEHCFRDKIEEFKDTPLDIILQNPPEFTVEIDKKIIKCTISPMFMQNDDYVGYIIVMLDVTKETEVNNLKNQFISNVSHELRTPVTVLRTYIDTLYTMGEELDEETRKEFTETANKEVTRLHRMVNDILDVSRLESPDVELEKEMTDITPVLADTITSMQVLADEKNVKIQLEKPLGETILPINVANMERVFNNLISNAIKYSPEKSTIDVVLKLDGEFADISVTDHGCGIAEENLPKLFERFYRVENSVHTVKGTGLGLYLVKTTIEKHHNGKVYVKSKVGEGSTFGIKIPLSL